MRGEIDGLLVKIAGLSEIHGAWTATPLRMEALSICLIIGDKNYLRCKIYPIF
jgi:hypothetical protein